ncbi:MAG TPA: hypothetical protein VIU93_07050 [Gallionellaceae bacterium]
MENVLRANPLDVREQYERQLKELQEAYGEAMLELRAREKLRPCWARTRNDRDDLPGPAGRRSYCVDQQAVSVVLHSTPGRLLPPDEVYPQGSGAIRRPVQGSDRRTPSFGYRVVAYLRGFNKNTVQRIFQLKHWQVQKRPVGFRPRIQALPSVASKPNERWATDLCRVWSGRNHWAVLALVTDCHTRELLGWAFVEKREIEDH